jgi:hypothetical protein
MIEVLIPDPSTKLSTSTDAAIEPNIMTIMYIFFSHHLLLLASVLTPVPADMIYINLYIKV